MKAIYSLLLMAYISFGYSQNIVQMEYFIDIDPGFGNGQNISGFSSQSNVMSFGFPITNTQNNGIHTIGYRAKDANNIWSHTNFRTFYVINSTPLQNMTGMEYFIDVDPGFGNATTVANFPSNTSTTTSNFGFTITNNLSNGIHIIGYRTKDVSGKWSHTDFSSFCVLENNILNDIVELEYFWSVDAGFGNNSIYEIPTGTTDLSNHIFQANVPPSLLVGQTYPLLVRAKDSNGIYSHTNYVTEITIDEALNITDLEKINIHIYPNPVQDFLTVTSKDNDSFRFILYDINGKKITDIKVNSYESINLSNISSGTYIGYVWKDKDKNKIKAFKILKQ